MYVHKSPEGDVMILNGDDKLLAVMSENLPDPEETAKKFVFAQVQLQELAARIRALIESSSLSRALKEDKDADAYMKARSEARLSLHNFGL